MSTTSKWWLSAVLLLIPMAAQAQPLRSAVGDIEVRTYAPPIPEWRSAQVIHDSIVREVRAASRDQSVTMTIDVVGSFSELASLVGVDRAQQIFGPLRRFEHSFYRPEPQNIPRSVPISPIRGTYLFLAENWQSPETLRLHCLVIYSLHEMCLEDTFMEAIEKGWSRSSLAECWANSYGFKASSGTYDVRRHEIDPDCKIKNFGHCAGSGWPVDYDKIKPEKFLNGISLRVNQCFSYASATTPSQTPENRNNCRWMGNLRLPPPLECRH